MDAASRSIQSLLVILIAFIIAASSNPATAQEREAPHILILSSYHQGYAWSDGEIQGIFDTLPTNVVVDIEHMDTKRFNDPAYLELYYSVFTEKFAGQAFDAIVTLDDNAFRFMLDLQPMLYADTPVIFGGVNNLEPAELNDYDLFTGIIERIDYPGTIETFLALHPNTEQVLVITDTTTTGLVNRTKIKFAAAAVQSPVEFVFLNGNDGLDYENLKALLGDAPANSLIYYSDFFQDKHGQFVHYKDIMPVLSALSPVPLYVHNDFYVGHGAIGGKVLNGYYHGLAVGSIVQRVLSGEKPSQITIEPGPLVPMFDYNQLQRWNISEESLPGGSLIINKPEPSFYERYYNTIWVVGIFSVAQTALIIYLILNIVTRRRAERTLKESELRYRSIVEVSPLPIAIHTGGHYVFVNQAAIETLGGHGSSDFIGKPIKDFIDPAYWVEVQQHIQKIHAGRSYTPLMERKFRRLDGVTIDVLVTATMITFEGNPASQVVFYDVTARKHAEQDRFNLALERERVNMLRNFIADASHDLKNPLTTIKTTLYMLRQQLMKLGTQDTRHLQTIDAQVQRLTRMVDDMLHMSRLDATEQVEFRSVNLNELIGEIVSGQQARIDQKRLSLEFEACGESCVVEADDLLLSRAITNLIENAILYTPANGSITITTVYQSDFIGCEVRDTGIGIPTDDLPHIFERFYRSERGRQSNHSGSGLGLAIAHKIITLHGGTIRASSEPNQGSIFRIELPHAA